MKLSATRVAVWLLVGFALLILFLPLFQAGGSVLGAIFFGWFSFLKRVLPNVTVSWSGIGMVALCSILLLGGIHSFCKWLLGHVSIASNKGTAQEWRWSWTISLYLAVWLLFAAIMGAVGVIHQVGWLLRSNEPTFKPRKYVGLWRSQLRQSAMNLTIAAEESKWNLDATRREFFRSETSNFSFPNGVDDLHVILLGGSNGDLAAGVIFYRDPEARAKAGYVFVSPEVSGELRPIEDLPALLSRYQSQSAPTPR